MIDETKENGFDSAYLPDLKLVYEYKDIWRNTLGRDKPAEVEPLKVKLQDGSKAYRCKQRKYPDRQRDSCELM